MRAGFDGSTNGKLSLSLDHHDRSRRDMSKRVSYIPFKLIMNCSGCHAHKAGRCTSHSCHSTTPFRDRVYIFISCSLVRGPSAGVLEAAWTCSFNWSNLSNSYVVTLYVLKPEGDHETQHFRNDKLHRTRCHGTWRKSNMHAK